ncbi:MAG: hypothetical protein HYS35_09930 [Betaproteobacteria bacterium]|nr:hypothetical protein [Betaproteobacteria bacterium]
MSLIGYRTVVFCALGALSLPAAAAEPGRAADVHKRYLEERAYCLGIKQAEDRTTCLREAGAAQIEARRGTLAKESADFEQNRFARCAYHKRADEREYCERRMRGEGSVSGSVAAGGILRELTVIVPAD